MKRNSIKRGIIVAAALLITGTWVCIKYIFPQAGIALFESKSHPKSDENNKDDELAYYDELYHPENQEREERNLRGGTILKKRYSVTGATVTKELDAETEQSINRPEVQVSNHKIINEYSVVCVSLSIINERDTEIMDTPNVNLITVYRQGVCERRLEPFLMEPYTYAPASAQHFHLTLQPGEDAQITLFYIVPDEYLGEEVWMKFCLNPCGLDENAIPNPDDDASRYIVYINLEEIMKETGAGE